MTTSIHRTTRLIKSLALCAGIAAAVSGAIYVAVRPKMTRAMLIPETVFKTRLPVDAVAITPDGKFVIAAVDNFALSTKEYARTHLSMRVWPSGEIYVWDARSQRRVRTLKPFNQAVTSLVVSPDGTKLAADEQLGASLWDIPTGRLIWRKQSSFGKPSFTPDGKTLRFVDYDLDIASQALRRTAKMQGRQSALTISPDQRTVATIDEDFQYTKAVPGQEIGFRMSLIRGGRPHLWNENAAVERCELPYDLTRNVAFSPDGCALALVSDLPNPTTPGLTVGSVLRMTNAETQAVLWRKTWGKSGFSLLNSLAFSPSGRTVAVEDFQHQVFLIDAQNGRLTRRLTPYFRIDTSQGVMMSPTGLAFSKDGKLLVSRADHAVCVWNTEDVK